MFVLAAQHPVLTAVLAVLAVWVVRFVRKGYFVRKTLHDQVSLLDKSVFDILEKLLIESDLAGSASFVAMGTSEDHG